ncbi:MAG: Mur ligase domain-containing protein, partial [Planctomycetota bacterium]
MSLPPSSLRPPSTTALSDYWTGRKILFVGIGGVGMSGLARLARSRGAIVSGSDRIPTIITEGLIAEGISVSFDQDGGELPEGTELVIHSAAIPADHPELLAAQSASIETQTYAQALGSAMLGRTGVAVAGTHGKSTTTAMLGVALKHSGLDPSAIVGAACQQLNDDDHAPSGFRLGSATIPQGPLAGEPGLILAEACEFQRSFHNLRPTLAAITSVEADHLDIYGSLDAVVQAFCEFARLLPEAKRGGRLLINHEGAHRREVTAGVSCDVRTIGFAPTADYHISVELGGGAQRIEIAEGRHRLCGFDLNLPGEHMAFDAATAAVLATWCGADPYLVGEALSNFQGVDRRMQFRGELRGKGWDESSPGVRLYDDYGHHPTE